MLKNKKFLLTLLIFLSLITLPYLYGFFAAPEGFSFTGFFVNYFDGHSYLGKMQQGYQGNWLFSLDYSPETSPGVFIMVPYLTLGHLMRLFGGNPLLWLHGVRLGAAIVLACSLYRFMQHLFPEDEKLRWWAYTFALFGAGLGWTALLGGAFTMDFWVAEAYPFLASYTNLHFPLGLALQLWLLTPDASNPSTRQAILLVLGGILLGLISAFSVPVVLTVWGGVFLVRWIRKGDPMPIFWRGFWIGLGGLPVIAYDYFAILSDPVLSVWNAQNVTASPPLWDVLLSFSPALLLAVPGLYFAWRRNQLQDQVLISWVLLCFVLAFSPFPLQRRFFIGYSIPLAALAIVGISSLFKPSRQPLVWLTIFLLALPTNLILLLGSVFGVNSVSPQIYIHPDEQAAFSWMAENMPENALILAAPETGTLLPAYTDVRVIYGHPFESLHAEEREAWLLDFYTGKLDAQQAESFIFEIQADYIFVGPREQLLGQADWIEQLELVYEAGEVTIYAIGP